MNDERKNFIKEMHLEICRYYCKRTNCDHRIGSHVGCGIAIDNAWRAFQDGNAFLDEDEE